MVLVPLTVVGGLLKWISEATVPGTAGEIRHNLKVLDDIWQDGVKEYLAEEYVRACVCEGSAAIEEEKGGYLVRCPECERLGPLRERKHQAAEVWNIVVEAETLSKIRREEREAEEESGKTGHDDRLTPDAEAN